MKGYRTRAKTATFSFPVKHDADERVQVLQRDREQATPTTGKYVFKLEDVLPSIQGAGHEAGKGDNSIPSNTAKTLPALVSPGTNRRVEVQVPTPQLSRRRQPIASNQVLDLPNESLNNIRQNLKSAVPSTFAQSASSGPNALLAPTLNPKLKLLKSQAQALLARNFVYGHDYSAAATLKNINSLLAPMNFSTSSRPSKQFSPATIASYQYGSIKSAARHTRSSTTMQGPSQALAPSSSSSISSKSKQSRSSPSASQKSTETELTKQPSQKLVATTTEIELLKLTPRDPTTIKSGMFIIDNPAKMSNPSQTKKYHICRSAEERDLSPDTVHLDKLNLKHFPSIDSSETQLRLLSLQHNLIHRIDNTNLTIQPNLLVLDLYNNRIDRISGLHIFSSLKVLLLGKNRIRRIEGLDMLKHLEILDLHGNQLRYLDNINSLMSLRVLNVAGNVIRSIRNFGPYGISSLQELNLKRNHIQNLTGILKITHLKKLSLGNNSIDSVSMLLPLKKLDMLQELQLQPNPVCDLPDYEHQILALLPKLALLDSNPVTEEMKYRAEIWHRKKIAEEHERRKEQEKIRLLSTTATRDEVILKARKRWESLRNYVKQNSLGSGKFTTQKGKETHSEDRLVRQNAINDTGIMGLSQQSFLGHQDQANKFSVELEIEVEPKVESILEYDIKDTLPVVEVASIGDVYQNKSMESEESEHGKSEKGRESGAIEAAAVQEFVSFTEPTPDKVSTDLQGPTSIARPPVQIAIVRPSVRAPSETLVPAPVTPEETPSMIVPILRKIPMLMNAMKSTGQSILEEDEEEDMRSESTRLSSEYGATEEPTLLEEESRGHENNSVIETNPQSSLPFNQLDLLGSTRIPLPNLKLPSRRPILRRSVSQFTLSVTKESQSSPSPRRSASRPLVPKTTVNVNGQTQSRLRKSLSRSKSIADLPNGGSNDSDTPSDIESVVTINTTSDTGSTTTSNATPRKHTTTGRGKLIRSNSSKNLLKPRGKTARLTSTPLIPISHKRPLTGSATNTGTVKPEPLRPILRRSESAVNLHSPGSALAPEVVVKKQGVDYLVEMNDKLLNIYGQGALKHMLTAFSSNSTGNITMATFHFITFDSIISYFGKMRQVYPALEHFHFRANGLTCLSQLNALADLQGITSLYVYQDGNSLIENSCWQEYAMHRLGHWGLQQVNGVDISSNCRSLASLKESENQVKTFDSLGYLALSCLPQSALTPLAERLHMLHCFCCCSASNSSDDSGKKRPDGLSSSGNTCTSYWADDPVLLDVIGKEALVYALQNETSSTNQSTVTEIFDKGCEIVQKLTKLEQTWPTLMVDVIEEILLDYQVMDNFMKKELIGLKNSLSAPSPSSNSRRKPKF